MTSLEIYEIVKNPALLTADTLPRLKQVVDDFPFFQTARMLYLKNLAQVGDIRFSSELRKMSVYISDRRKLFTLIEGDRYNLSVRDNAVSSGEEEKNTFELIEDFLASRMDKADNESEESLLFQPSVSSDYVYWALTEETFSGQPKENLSSPEFRHQELIDDFIKNDRKRTPEGSLIQVGEKETSFEPEDPDENNELPPEDSFFTETLARIYIKQKRYEKALQIIKNLSLKYPEKNIYFADQIRFLEKLIINTKK